MKSSATSAEAALSIEIYAGNLRELIFAYLQKHPAATREEVATGLDLLAATVSARMTELLRDRQVRVLDCNGKTRSGCRAERLVVISGQFALPPDTREINPNAAADRRKRERAEAVEREREDHALYLARKWHDDAGQDDDAIRAQLSRLGLPAEMLPDWPPKKPAT